MYATFENSIEMITSVVFIAMAEPKGVRWSLARAYPMLETVLAHAYADLLPGLLPRHSNLSSIPHAVPLR